MSRVAEKAAKAARAQVEAGTMTAEERYMLIGMAEDYVATGSVPPQEVFAAHPMLSFAWSFLQEDLEFYRGKVTSGGKGGRSDKAEAKQAASESQAEAKQAASKSQAEAKQAASKSQAGGKPLSIPISTKKEPSTKSVEGSKEAPSREIAGDEVAGEPFEPPTLDECVTYARANQLYRPDDSAQSFYDHYQANAWLMGNGHALDSREAWQARLRGWAREQQERANSVRGRPRGSGAGKAVIGDGRPAWDSCGSAADEVWAL